MARISGTTGSSSSDALVASLPSGGDDTSMLSAAMDAANTAGKPLRLRRGTYISGQITKTYSVQIECERGVTIVAASGATSGWLWTFNGSAGSQVTLTASTLTGSKVIAAATTGISAGDLVRVGSTALLRDESVTVQPRYLGQLAEVDTIDSASQLTLKEPVHSDFLTADTAWVQKVTPLDDLAIIGRPRFTNPAANTTTLGFLNITFGRDLEINVKTLGASAAAVQLAHCFRGDVVQRGRESVANGTTRFGYGVLCSGSTAHMRVDTTMYHGGAAFNTSGIDNDWGGAYDNTATGTSVGATTIGFGTHPGARDTTFLNPHVIGAAGGGVGFRGNGGRIIGGLIDQCGTNCVGMLDDAQNIEIVGVRFRDAPADCISYTQNSANPAGDLSIKIRGCDASGLARSFAKFNLNSGTLSGIDILDNTVRNFGLSLASTDQRSAFAFYAPVDRMNVKRNVVSDSQGSPTGLALTYFAAAASKGLVEDNECLDGITLTNSSSSSTVTFGRNTLGTSTAKAKVPRTLAVTSGTLDLSKGDTFELSLTANRTLVFSNPVDGMELDLTLIQDATGSRTVTWPASVIWPGTTPVLQTASSSVDRFKLRYSASLTKWIPVNPPKADTIPSAVNVVYPWDAQDLKGWSMDPAGGATSGIAPTGGAQYAMRILIPENITITNIVVSITTAGVTMTSGQNFVALYDQTGVLLGQSADQATNFQSSGDKVIPLVTPVAVTGGKGKWVYAGPLVNGTTLPLFTRGGGGATAGSSPTRTGRTTTTNNTAPPATLTLGSLQASTLLFVGIS